MRLRTLLLVAVAIVGLAPAASAETGESAPAIGDTWQAAGSPNARKLIKAALAQEGRSYCWGGGDADGPTLGSKTSQCDLNTGPGFDCSGLVHYSLNQAGMPVEDLEASRYAELGTEVSTPIPGDLLFYDRQANDHIEHVAIFLGTRDTSGKRWVIEAYGDEGWTAPKYRVRIREYVKGEEVLIKRMFTLQPKPSMSAVTFADGSVKLQWDDYADETGYHLTYGQSQVIVNADTTTRTVTNLPADSQVCFRLQAFAAYEASDWSTPACAWTRLRPPAPTDVRAAPEGTNSIKVTWLDNATTETGYSVITESGHESLPVNTTSHVWTGLEPGTTACFTVAVFNSAGSTTSAEPVCATTLTNGPAAPSNLTAEVLDGNVVHLMWTDNAGDETGLLVRRRVGDYIDYVSQFTYPNATEEWVFDEPVGVDICYSVAATRGGSRSTWSNEACVRLI